MYLYPSFRATVASGMLLLSLSPALSGCKQQNVSAEDFCTDSQDFSLPANVISQGAEDGIAPDVSLTVFTIDEDTDCLTEVFTANCVAGECDEDAVLTIDRQPLFIRVVAMDEGGMRNLDAQIADGYFLQDGSQSDAAWISYDYAFDGSRNLLFSERPSDAVFMQDVFQLDASGDAAMIWVTASDHGRPGSEPASSTLSVWVTHGDLATSLP